MGEETFPLPSGYPYTPGTTHLYRLSYWNAGDGTWDVFCGEDPVDGTLNVGIPMQGVWDRTGARASSSTHFTFACTPGVIARCYRWGYRPPGQRRPEAGGHPRPLSNACSGEQGLRTRFE